MTKTASAAVDLEKMSLAEKLDLAVHLQHRIWNAKKLYAQMDELAMHLKKKKEKVPVVHEYKGRPYAMKLKRNFSGRNVEYGHGAVRLVELEVKPIKKKKPKQKAA